MFKLDVGRENHTSHPSRWDVLFYPGGISEKEILLAYGSTCFASKMGQPAGNHFMTIITRAEKLGESGRLVLWKGAQDIVFENRWAYLFTLLHVTRVSGAFTRFPVF